VATSSTLFFVARTTASGPGHLGRFDPDTVARWPSASSGVLRDHAAIGERAGIAFLVGPKAALDRGDISACGGAPWISNPLERSRLSKPPSLPSRKYVKLTQEKKKKKKKKKKKNTKKKKKKKTSPPSSNPFFLTLGPNAVPQLGPRASSARFMIKPHGLQ
jgi:hypothetical protein